MDVGNATHTSWVYASFHTCKHLCELSVHLKFPLNIFLLNKKWNLATYLETEQGTKIENKWYLRKLNWWWGEKWPLSFSFTSLLSWQIHFFFLVKSKIEEPEMMMSILLPSAWTPSRAGVIYQPTCHCCVGESHPTGKWKFRFVMWDENKVGMLYNSSCQGWGPPNRVLWEGTSEEQMCLKLANEC